ncbi:hypothetical protein LAV_00077 [Sphingobium phage Lacusarx]|uniref:Uncharacterized protein n=1 Tax=Sphingobium phage Lacusarx TaxID=1980139 RepID=A0A1W6DWT5_9CAUD|nr:hypothetical protein FDH44_gp077 [Sphingobium phage Lacusarx]ARK07477.1 hypothetical protein LAV_00077 [Sphingobium phage Lacusarx]
MVTQEAMDDFDEADCLCQGKAIPKEKWIDFMQRVFDEKTQLWKWKTVLRYHKDCPIHGIHIKDDECPEA